MTAAATRIKGTGTVTGRWRSVEDKHRLLKVLLGSAAGAQIRLCGRSVISGIVRI